MLSFHCEIPKSDECIGYNSEITKISYRCHKTRGNYPFFRIALAKVIFWISIRGTKKMLSFHCEIPKSDECIGYNSMK